MATKARERLLDTAEELFYAEGIRACGVERILQRSGVGRASFYRHFQSKDDLVVAVLEGRDARWRAWLEKSVEDLVAERNPAPEDRPLVVFDALAERFSASDFRGCAFINTMAETADPGSAAFRTAAGHKHKVIGYLDRLLRESGYDRHRELAEQFSLLIDGAIVAALRERAAAPAAQARAVAAALLAVTRGPCPG